MILHIIQKNIKLNLIKRKGSRFINLYSNFLKRHITSRCAPVDDSPEFTKGFTLIELMIATTLFTIVMMMGVGSLVVSSNFAKASQKLRVAVDNVNFAMESMTRELRTGTHYYCNTTYTMANDNLVGDCVGGTVIAFNPQLAPITPPYRVAYYKSLRADGVTNTLIRCEFPSSGPCPSVVSNDVDIKMLKFYVTGSSLSDKIQPSVEIIIKGVVTVKGVPTPFSLQSMATQRSTEQ